MIHSIKLYRQGHKEPSHSYQVFGSKMPSVRFPCEYKTARLATSLMIDFCHKNASWLAAFNFKKQNHITQVLKIPGVQKDIPIFFVVKEWMITNFIVCQCSYLHEHRFFLCGSIVWEVKHVTRKKRWEWRLMYIMWIREIYRHSGGDLADRWSTSIICTLNPP